MDHRNLGPFNADLIHLPSRMPGYFSGTQKREARMRPIGNRPPGPPIQNPTSGFQVSDLGRKRPAPEVAEGGRPAKLPRTDSRLALPEGPLNPNATAQARRSVYGNAIPNPNNHTLLTRIDTSGTQIGSARAQGFDMNRFQLQQQRESSFFQAGRLPPRFPSERRPDLSLYTGPKTDGMRENHQQRRNAFQFLQRTSEYRRDVDNIQQGIDFPIRKNPDSAHDGSPVAGTFRYVEEGNPEMLNRNLPRLIPGNPVGYAPTGMANTPGMVYDANRNMIVTNSPSPSSIGATSLASSSSSSPSAGHSAQPAPQPLSPGSQALQDFTTLGG